MRTPTPAQLLQVWERGGEHAAAAGSLWLLAACCDDRGVDALAALPLGRRDALLLELHARLFGAELAGLAACPRCATAVETAFRCDDVLSPRADDGATAPALELSADGIHVRFRLPDSNDLLAAEACRDAAQARRLLLERCVLEARSGQGRRAAAELPAAVQAQVAQAMACADPQADLQLAVRCPACDCQWQPSFDIARFLWQELHAWALRMLRDIDTLAQAYHWGEAEILALSPRRRQAYLELCAS